MASDSLWFDWEKQQTRIWRKSVLKKCKWVHHEKQMKGVFGDVDQERKMSEKKMT